MLATLMLLGGLHFAWADDIPKDTNYTIRQNISCPASGNFFKRDVDPNSREPSVCNLCFCQDNSTAVCWRRENRICDMEHLPDFGKSISRKRRSPLNFGEVFVRDAAREFFNKQTPEQCKPFESSFSDGCPPADWCIGCTVCDCDANGRWDCHILSFCPDKTGKKHMKKQRGYSKDRKAKRQSKTSTANALRSPKYTPKPPKKPTRKRAVSSTIKRNQVKQSSANNKKMMNRVKATKVNKFAPVKKPLPNIQSKKASSSRKTVTSKPLLIKKKALTSKSLSINSNRDKSTKNNTIHVAQKVVKQFMTTMQKMIKNIDRQTNITSKQVDKLIQKRSMSKQPNRKGTKEIDNKPKFVAKPISRTNINRKYHGKRQTPKPHNASTQKNVRIKRQASVIESSPYTSDAGNSSKETAINKIEENMKTNKIQDLFKNLTIAVMNITHTFNNKTLNLTQLKNSINQEMYITDNDVYKEHHGSIVKDALFNLSNTESTILWIMDNYSTQQNRSNYNFEELSVFTTDSPYVSTKFSQLSKNGTNMTQNLQKNNNEDSENEIYKIEKKYSNISTQTEHHNCKFNTLLQKLVGADTNRYNYTVKSLKNLKKPKRYTILTKIKRLFKRIFNKHKRSKYHHKDNLYYRDYDTKEFAYRKFINCKLDPKEKEKLRERINELKIESDNILKTVRIIKGLLHLLEINTNETQNKVSIKSYGTNDNISKLKAIVKNTYTKEESGQLTEDQRTQINYIKKNVQVFIKSVGKFARILDYVIQIAMYHNKRQNKVNNIKVVNDRNDTSNILIKDSTTKNKLAKLKKLILNYNLLQNKFINDIYVILNNLEVTVTGKNNLQHVHGNNYTKINQSDAIQTNSVSIIKNIRKLKILAEKMNAQKRRKRETIDDDDGLEYLLILMEYLLKKQAPTYPPVNDGIDLLIEAIKSAPDIKLVRKKVLDNIEQKPFVTRTTTPTNSINKDNYTTLVKGRKEINITFASNKHKIIVADQSQGDDDDDDDKIEEFYRSFKSDTSSEQKQDDISSSRNIVPTTVESYHNIKVEAITPKNNKDNAVRVLDSSDNMSVELQATSMSPTTVSTNLMTAKLKDSVKSNGNIDNFLVNSKANIDWIEENFKEIKQPRVVKTMSSTPNSLSATRTLKLETDISDVTDEITVYNDKKDEKLMSAEEVMSKKEMDLLNSLDYVGEKDVEDEMDSRDDKYLSDT